MKIITFLLLATFTIVANAAGKTAFINSKLLLEQAPQAIAANQQLREQFGSREQDLRLLAQEIKGLEQNYQRDAAIMSVEQKQKSEDEILQARRRFQLAQQSLREDLQAKQRELLQSVQVTIRSAIREFGEANGYEFIFTDSGIAYASDSLDITDEILKLLQK